jgi:hypothetical protein
VDAQAQDRGSAPGRVAEQTRWRKKEKSLFFHGKKTGFWRQMTILLPTYLGAQALPSKKNRHVATLVKK